MSSSIILVLFNLFLLCIIVNCVDKNNFSPIVQQAGYDQDIRFTVNKYNEFIFLFPNSPSPNPFKVIAESPGATLEYPVLLVVRQQKNVLSWQLPLIVSTHVGDLAERYTSRTLCHNDQNTINQLPREMARNSINTLNQDLIIAISTSSEKYVQGMIRVTQNFEFHIQDNTNYTTTISASEPNYFYYKFPKNNTEGYQTVVLKVGADYKDACFTVSIQNSTCPIMDLNQDIAYDGIYQTVNTKGGITISQKSFPFGFFLVFVAKGDTYGCVSEGVMTPLRNAKIMQPNKRFDVKFKIKKSITTNDYATAALTVLGCIGLFYIIFITVILLFLKYSVRPQSIEETSVVDAVTEPIANEQEILQCSSLCLKDLLTKDLNQISNSSLKYLWHVMTVALFYGLPVVQLVITYQIIVNRTGNQDICYYNFLCAHPLADMSDFNHVYSNIGYCLLGLLFIVITLARQRKLQSPNVCKNYGIPPHFGLSYAMGVALVIEGVLSACYHVCPNQSNYQFDTSFMYVMAVLCAIKLYQNRHPGVNATAYGAFGLLGLAIFLAMLGIFNAELYFWIIFIIIYLIICLYVTIQIYFLGYFNLDYIRQVFNMPVVEGITPNRLGRLITLMIANLINWLLAAMGIAIFVNDWQTDFATYLLAIFMTNTTLYLVFYVIMKLVHKERICLQATIFLILSTVTWAGATYFFLQKSTLWSVTAAESKKFNMECTFIRFYDNHDIWHMLSAPALFFTFMVLLTIDDDLLQTHHRYIHVF